MPLFQIRSEDRGAFVVATGYGKAVYVWTKAVAREQGLDEADELDQIEVPKGVDLIADDSDLIINGEFFDVADPDNSNWTRNIEVTLDCLLLVIDFPSGLPDPNILDLQFGLLGRISLWADDMLQEAEAYAGAIHFAASDNDDVEIPPKPKHYEELETWLAEAGAK